MNNNDFSTYPPITTVLHNTKHEITHCVSKAAFSALCSALSRVGGIADLQTTADEISAVTHIGYLKS